MIGAWITIAIGFIALSLHGYWHGERRYRTGVRHGRRLEAMEARLRGDDQPAPSAR